MGSLSAPAMCSHLLAPGTQDFPMIWAGREEREGDAGQCSSNTKTATEWTKGRLGPYFWLNLNTKTLGKYKFIHGCNGLKKNGVN